MRGSLTQDPGAGARFEREAKLVSKIRHPHVVEVLDTGFESGAPYIAMELLEGETLASALARRERLPLRHLVDIFLPLASAVISIHDAGITHRDLKTSNVMLVRRDGIDAYPVLLDFGISKIDESGGDEPTLTRSEALIGTTKYLSPEQTMNAKAASALSDQYAIGVMLYECATGRRPFAGSSHYEIMHAILTASVVPPSAIVPELPASFDALVLRAMSRRPEHRFSSMRELAHELLSFAEGEAWTPWAREFAFVSSSVPELEHTAADARTSQGEPSSRTPATSRARALQRYWHVGLVGCALLGAAAMWPAWKPMQRVSPALAQGLPGTTKLVSHIVARPARSPGLASANATVTAPSPASETVSKAKDLGAVAPRKRRTPLAPNTTAQNAPSQRSTGARVLRASTREPGEDDAIDPFALDSHE